MYNISRKIVAVSLITALMVISLNTNAFAQLSEPTAGAMAADTLVGRPLGIASQALGCVLFVISLPFSLPGKNVSTVFKKTIVEPAKFTWTRPVGKII